MSDRTAIRWRGWSIATMLGLFVVLLAWVGWRGYRLRQADQAVTRGLVYHKQGDFLEAMTYYTEAIRLRPDLAQAYNNRASARKSIGDFQLAIADFTQAIALAPDQAVLYLNRGQAYLEQGDYTAAVSDLTRAIELDPNLSPAYFHRATAYKLLGENEKSAADLAHAEKLRRREHNET